MNTGTATSAIPIDAEKTSCQAHEMYINRPIHAMTPAANTVNPANTSN
ncbi:MAG: hypothetical protein HY423_07805 [Candidatus Lambdaproteobacteria bacterium]|nr:hypothetical protein [Candidatus Lambdaproteobacteria bacterium]